MKNVRTLESSEIECRIGTISQKGCTILLYKDARVDMRLLDEIYGQMNWKRSHEVIDGNLYCTISIWDAEKKEWISKQDVGTESFTEKEKGQASDSFKRAGFNWGIGRELYTAPFIWITPLENEFDYNNGRYSTKTKFSVSKIEYNEAREISALVIVDNKGRTRYTFGVSAPKAEPAKSVKQEAKANEDYQKVLDLISNAKSIDDLKKVYSNNPQLHKHANFMAHMTAKREALQAGL